MGDIDSISQILIIVCCQSTPSEQFLVRYKYCCKFGSCTPSKSKPVWGDSEWERMHNIVLVVIIRKAFYCEAMQASFHDYKSLKSRQQI